MKNLALAGGLFVSLAVVMLGCETSKRGLGGGPDSGASGSGGSAAGGSYATGGTIGSGGAAGHGGGSSGGTTGSGGASASGGSAALGGTGLAGGTTATGGVTGSGGQIGTGGVTVTGGVTGSGGAKTGGSSGASTGGARTGGSGGAGTGGAKTGGSPGSGGNGTGGRGTGGAGSGGVGTGGGVAGSGGGGGLGGFGGHTSCQSDTECNGFKCCNNLCSNLQNDIFNCGDCGTTCSGPNPYCNGGKCGTPPCSGSACGTDSTCCSNQCCGAGKLCCMVTLGPSMIGCFDPVDGTCPTGCAACACAAPTTPIATPRGERPIAELEVGDWVYSVDRGQIRAVPIKRIHRQSVSSTHTMVQLRLASGRALLISPQHPTADGRRFRDLARGDRLDGVAIVEARPVGYGQPFTYDILPDSDSGAYFAASVLVGSTLAVPAAAPLVSAASGGGEAPDRGPAADPRARGCAP